MIKWRDNRQTLRLRFNLGSIFSISRRRTFKDNPCAQFLNTFHLYFRRRRRHDDYDWSIDKFSS